MSQQTSSLPPQTSNNPSQTQSATQSNSVSNTGSSSSSAILVPATAPVGILSITQPPQTATSFYKIGPNNLVTFGWNFSFVSVTPEHLTVSAVGANRNTYPVGPADGVIDGKATQVVWDLNSYQQANPQLPLAATTYTLHISDGSMTTRRPGYLSPNTMVTFALYTPQPYTAISDGWSCGACSSASNVVAHPAFISIMVSLFVIFLSGVHLFRNGNAR